MKKAKKQIYITVNLPGAREVSLSLEGGVRKAFRYAKEAYPEWTSMVITVTRPTNERT